MKKINISLLLLVVLLSSGCNEPEQVEEQVLNPTLSFKEEVNEYSVQELDLIRTEAQKALNDIANGMNFSDLGKNLALTDDGIVYEVSDYLFEDDLGQSLVGVLPDLEVGDVNNELLDVVDTYFIDEFGDIHEDKKLGIVRLIDKVVEDLVDEQYKYEIITYSLVPEPWKDTPLDESYLIMAEVQLDEYYQPYILIMFDDEGAKLFEEITERNVGKSLGIFINDELISAPVVNEAISGGSAQIAGDFTNEEAEQLADGLNSIVEKSYLLK